LYEEVGMVDSSAAQLDWRSSSRSGENNCVEVACGPREAVRDDAS